MGAGEVVVGELLVNGGLLRFVEQVSERVEGRASLGGRVVDRLVFVSSC